MDGGGRRQKPATRSSRALKEMRIRCGRFRSGGMPLKSHPTSKSTYRAPVPSISTLSPISSVTGKRIRHLLVHHVRGVRQVRACKHARASCRPRHAGSLIGVTDRPRPWSRRGPPNLPMSRYTQAAPRSSSLFLEIRTTFGLDHAGIADHARVPASMMVSGNLVCRNACAGARKIDRPYCTTGGTSLRYLVGESRRPC